MAMNAHDFFSFLEQHIPNNLQEDWDNSGVQVVGELNEISKVAVFLEPTQKNIIDALAFGADCLISHHPLSMKAQFLSRKNSYTDIVRLLMKKGAWLYAAHTSLDSLPNGNAFWIGDACKLTDRKVLEPSEKENFVRFSFVKNHLSDEINEQIDISPFVHSVMCCENICHVFCFCEKEQEAQEFIMKILPNCAISYTKVAYPMYTAGLGEYGKLPRKYQREEFLSLLQNIFISQEKKIQYKICGKLPEQIETVAYCLGSGSDFAPLAFGKGADVFLTGDVKYHAAVACMENEQCIIDMGHFELEEEMMRRFTKELAAQVACEVRFFSGENPFSYSI